MLKVLKLGELLRFAKQLGRIPTVPRFVGLPRLRKQRALTPEAVPGQVTAGTRLVLVSRMASKLEVR